MDRAAKRKAMNLLTMVTMWISESHTISSEYQEPTPTKDELIYQSRHETKSMLRLHSDSKIYMLAVFSVGLSRYNLDSNVIFDLEKDHLRRTSASFLVGRRCGRESRTGGGGFSRFIIS